MEKFLELLTTNEEVREEFLNQKTPEDAYRVAKPYIGDVSMDEFRNTLLGVARVMDKLQSGQELDENELNTVSGGFNFNNFWQKTKDIKSTTIDKANGVINIGDQIIQLFKEN